MITFKLNAGGSTYEVQLLRTEHIAWEVQVLGHPEVSVQGNNLDEVMVSLFQALGDFSINGGVLSHVQAVGSTPNPSTTSTADPMVAILPEMEITFEPVSDASRVRVQFNGFFRSTSDASVEVYIDGVAVPNSLRSQNALVGAGTSRNILLSVELWTTLSVGPHTVAIRWRTSSGTLTAHAVDRVLVVTEFGE